MGGKQSKTKQNYPKLPERGAKEQWEEEWETFISSHPGFTVSDVNWEENVENNYDEEQIRIVCVSDTHCQVLVAFSHQDITNTIPGTDHVGASATRGHLDTRWRLHQLWEEGGGGKVQRMVGELTTQVVKT